MKRLYETYDTDDSHAEQRNGGLGFFIKPLYFVILLWMVFWIDRTFHLELFQFGTYPRHLVGLKGILFTPLIHGSAAHVASNSIPILILGSILFYFYPKIAWKIILVSWLLSSAMVWIIGGEGFHIGASGLVYALAGFIFLSGVLRRQMKLLALSFLVAFVYGSLFWGLFPIEEGVSWEAHLSGLVGGFLLAVRFRDHRPPQKKYSWELEEEEPEITIYPMPSENPSVPDWKKEAWKRYSTDESPVVYYYTPRKPLDKDNQNKP